MVIRSRKSKKDRQYNDKKKRNQRTNNQTKQKTKDRQTRTPLKTGDELRCSGEIISSGSRCGTRHATIATNQVINHEPIQDRIVITIMIVKYLSCLLSYVAGVLRSNQRQSLGGAMKRSLLITFVVCLGKY